jgi:hypothetical protein
MIEDIEYLNDHCEKDTATFYVDTNSRNREFFPYPAEFVVDFAQPFKLVNGFDILDAAIPTTMYNIDTPVVDNSFTLVSIPPYSSHDRMAHFQELTTSLIFSNIFETKIETTILVCGEDVLDTYNIQEADKLVSETVITLPHYVAIRRQLFNVPIVKQKNNINATMFYIMFQDNYYSVVNEPQNQAIIDILRDDNYSLTITAPNVFTVTYFEFYSVSETISMTIISNIEYIILVSNYTKSVEEGNYDVSTLRNDLNALWNDFGIFIENTTTVERKQGKFKLSSSELIIYNAKKSAMSKSIGFDLLPSSADKASYTPCQVRDNKRIYMGVYQEEEKIYLILAPGIVNLLGERFVILRCKEIEDHLLGSYAYMSYTPGIGMFKLAASYNDITNLRFDFVNLVRKPFHPIGKLHKMTFRFETSAGDLYDFKGVNIQILFMIKFLVPTQKFKFEKSILNPNYDPNFMKYMSTSKNIQYKEDSDNEEEFDNDKYYQMYKKEMDKYDYSSSGDEEGDDDGDSDEESEEEVVLSARRR